MTNLKIYLFFYLSSEIISDGWGFEDKVFDVIMADYNGSDNNDIIDVSELASDVINIYPGNGNDIIINATSQHNIVASPGEDSISGKNTSYALWQSRQNSTVNLKEGWADDGFGS